MLLNDNRDGQNLLEKKQPRTPRFPPKGINIQPSLMQLVGGYSSGIHQKEKAKLMIREGRNLSHPELKRPQSAVSVCLHSLHPRARS